MSIPPKPRTKVLFIMGMTRSGSTILDNVLGELDGFFSAGELRLLWKRGFLEGRQCGCQAPVLECDLWVSVLTRAFGERFLETLNSLEVFQWQRQVVKLNHTWGLLLRTPGRPHGRAALRSYTQVVPPLYRAITEVTGARVIVDSSKRPSDAALLRLLPELDLYFVHLVRDPRAVAYSWSRVKENQDPNAPQELARNGSLHSTLRWVNRNLAAEAVRKRVGSQRSLLLKYEDFIENPHMSLRAIARLVGEDPSQLPLNDDNTVSMRTNHTVSGNPSRFQTGMVRLSADCEWLRRQATADRLVSSALSLPLLRHYGYELWPEKLVTADAGGN